MGKMSGKKSSCILNDIVGGGCGISIEAIENNYVINRGWKIKEIVFMKYV